MSGSPLKLLPEGLPSWLKTAAEAANDNIELTARQVAEKRWGSVAAEAGKDVAVGGIGEAFAIATIVPAFLGTMGLAAYAYLADRHYYQNRRFTSCGTEPRRHNDPLMFKFSPLASQWLPPIRAQADGKMDPDTRQRLIEYASQRLSTQAPSKTCSTSLEELAESAAQLAELRDQLRAATIAHNEPLRVQLFRQIEALELRQQILLVDGTDVCGEDLLTPKERFMKNHPVRAAVAAFLRGGLAVARRFALPVTVVGVFGGVGVGGYHVIMPLAEKVAEESKVHRKKNAEEAKAREIQKRIAAEKSARRAQNHFKVRDSLDQYGVQKPEVLNDDYGSSTLVNEYMDHFLSAESKDQLMRNAQAFKAKVGVLEKDVNYGGHLCPVLSMLVVIVADNNLGDEFMPVLKGCFSANGDFYDHREVIMRRLVSAYVTNGVISDPASYDRAKKIMETLKKQ